MARRSNWEGYLGLSLAAASIASYPATSSSEEVPFDTLNRSTGNCLKREMVGGIDRREAVECDERFRSYAVAKASPSASKTKSSAIRPVFRGAMKKKKMVGKRCCSAARPGE
jgi:hypothetical protein